MIHKNNPDSIVIAKAKATTSAILDYAVKKRFDDLERSADIFDELMRRFPDNLEIRLLEANASTSTINAYGRAERFDDLERWTSRFDDLLQRFPELRGFDWENLGQYY